MAKNGAIISGAASGVGIELTKHLLGKGWRVVMTDINDAGEDIAKGLGSDVLLVQSGIAGWESQVSMFRKGKCTSALSYTAF
jgi:15-hydroxyprostaglandin dehydrogenase (NAD)